MAKRQKFKERYTIWKEWRHDSSTNGLFHDMMVLFNIIYSPSFEWYRMGYIVRVFINKICDGYSSLITAVSNAGKSVTTFSDTVKEAEDVIDNI